MSAWIEIDNSSSISWISFVALPVSAWIEILGLVIVTSLVSVALPVSAWIEIPHNFFSKNLYKSRTPRECVD